MIVFILSLFVSVCVLWYILLPFLRQRKNINVGQSFCFARDIYLVLLREKPDSFLNEKREEFLEELISFSHILEKKGLPLLPEDDLNKTEAYRLLYRSKPKFFAAFSKVRKNVLSLLVICFSLVFFSSQKLEAFSSLKDETSKTSEQSIPSLIFIEPSLGIASIHQFLLNPVEGGVFCYYVGLFSVPEEIELDLALPLPKGFQDLRLGGKEQYFELRQGIPVVKSTFTKGVHQIQISFLLPASWVGSVSWKKDKILSLPGMVFFMMPFVKEGAFHSFLSFLTGNRYLDTWPPRFSVPGFKEMIAEDPFSSFSKNKNTNDLKNSTPSLVFQAVRFEEGDYPEFKIYGIIPVRTGLWTLSIAIGFIFILVLLVMSRRKK